jgi:flagellar protein FlaG
MSIQSVSGTTSGNLLAARPSTQSASATPDAQLARATTVTQQAPSSTKDVQVSRQQLDQAVKAVNDFVKSTNNSLQFSVDEDSGKTIVKVVDITTKEVLKQFPSEEMLAIAKALDGIKGLLVHQKA